MRELGLLENRNIAQGFSDFLYVKGIQNRIEEEDGAWAVWIYDEEMLEESGRLLDNYLANPDDPEYKQFSKQAAAGRQEEENAEREYKKKMNESRIKWSNVTTNRFGPITRILMGISIAVFLVSGFGMKTGNINFLFITSFSTDGNMIRWLPGLRDIANGQLWRLFTPMFIHFSIIHILFNMMWLKTLGSEIENRISSRYLLLFALMVSAFSNVCQYLMSGPSFGGMSGVVYGLLGYIWIRGKKDPASGFFLDQTIVMFMLAWFFISMTGLVGNIANTAHGVGLACGMLWGFFDAQRAQLNKRG